MNLPLSSIAIDLGVHNRNVKEPWVLTVKASKVIKHVDFEMLSSVLNDIALVKLEV